MTCKVCGEWKSHTRRNDVGEELCWNCLSWYLCITFAYEGHNWRVLPS